LLVLLAVNHVQPGLHHLRTLASLNGTALAQDFAVWRLIDLLLLDAYDDNEQVRMGCNSPC